MRFAIEPETMLARCERLQWSTADIDWEAPGAHAVSETQRRALVPFMADLYWIESVAAIVFDAMSQQTQEPALRGIFASFAIDEARHAEAELLLMRRWKLVAPSELPAANINVRNLLGALDRAAHRVHPAVYSAIIPFTELVLDGALVKHLDARVADPICAEVFRRINADEARHLAVDFYMLERFGREQSRAANLRDGALALAQPAILYALFMGYLPMLLRSAPHLHAVGITDDQVGACIRRYIALGDQSRDAARHPAYAVFRTFSRGLIAGRTGLLDVLLRVSDVCDKLGLGMGARA
jgi:hypothetical protein